MSNELNNFSGLFSPKLITNVGGIILAILMSYYIFKITTNHLDHIDRAIQVQTEVQKDTNNVLRANAEALVGNTEILKIIERRLK